MMTVYDEAEIRLPLDLDEPDGFYTTAKAGIIAKRGGIGIAKLDDQSEIINEPDWAEDCGDVYFEVLNDGVSFRALRQATPEDYRVLRVPLWIHDDETPTCCGEPMSYVGHLEDDRLWQEPPAYARIWWHDAARFYVFTCPKCLAVAAVGQQD